MTKSQGGSVFEVQGRCSLRIMTPGKLQSICHFPKDKCRDAANKFQEIQHKDMVNF